MWFLAINSFQSQAYMTFFFKVKESFSQAIVPPSSPPPLPLQFYLMVFTILSVFSTYFISELDLSQRWSLFVLGVFFKGPWNLYQVKTEFLWVVPFHLPSHFIWLSENLHYDHIWLACFCNQVCAALHMTKPPHPRPGCRVW